jgi:hypothetical protein
MNGTPSIMLIRHAEKPAEGEQGVNHRGHPDPTSLSVTGWMRAGGLVRLFNVPDERTAMPHLVRPQFLVAARATDSRPSTRPRDTLQPLAQALGVAIDETLAADDPPHTVAAHLRQLPGPVLVCWRHDTLPALANELLQRAEAPGRWPEHTCDMVWVLEQASLNRTLVQVPQRVLGGDGTHAIRRRVPAKAA